MGVEIILNTGESIVWAILFFALGMVVTYVFNTYKLTKKFSESAKKQKKGHELPE